MCLVVNEGSIKDIGAGSVNVPESMPIKVGATTKKRYLWLQIPKKEWA